MGGWGVRAVLWMPGGRQDLKPGSNAGRGDSCRWLDEQAAGCQEEKGPWTW